jgi:methylamine--corrinoid protein Co-methyltransferase
MEKGPVANEKEFDLKMVSAPIQELVKKYQLKYDSQALVNTSDEMADRCFAAGLELAERTGVFCTSNNRRLVWSQRELEEGIRSAPSHASIGSGRDEHRDEHRMPEDLRRPTILGGSVGNPMPETLFLPSTQSYIQEPILDGVMNSTLLSVYGREMRTGSPWEILGAWHESELTIAAARRAGRVGIGIGCVASAASDIAEISATAPGGFRLTDFHHIAMISELKTDYKLLNKLAHMVKTDALIHSFYNPIYGGLAGSAEGMAILGVAGFIMLQMTYMTTTHSTSPTHPFFACNTTPEILWSTSLFTQALSRNTPFLTVVVITPVAGPGTKMLLYETAAMAALATTSGATRIMGPRSAAGTVPGNASGLEARWMGEVGHACAGMSREQASRIVGQLTARYSDELGSTEVKGQRFDQVYDLHTLQPTPEWLGMYDEVKQELAGMGLPL